MKVILDTDIGNDIDDALALSYLLRQPECELIGIVTSCGCAQTHAKIASAVCCAAGRKDVPIFAGTDDCIIIEQKEKYVPHATVLYGKLFGNTPMKLYFWKSLLRATLQDCFW